MNSLLKKPSAWIPITMSLVIVAMEIVLLNTFPIVHEVDEGTAAHLFQLLLAGQFPIILFFAAKWLPRAPKQALYVLVVQLIAGLTACFPVFYFRL